MMQKIRENNHIVHMSASRTNFRQTHAIAPSKFLWKRISETQKDIFSLFATFLFYRFFFILFGFILIFQLVSVSTTTRPAYSPTLAKPFEWVIAHSEKYGPYGLILEIISRLNVYMSTKRIYLNYRHKIKLTLTANGDDHYRPNVGNVPTT